MDFTQLELILSFFLAAAVILVFILTRKLRDQKKSHENTFDYYANEMHKQWEKYPHRRIYDGVLNGCKSTEFIYIANLDGVNVFYRFWDGRFIPNYLSSDEIVGEERDKIIEWMESKSAPRSIQQARWDIKEFNDKFPNCETYKYQEHF